MLGLMFVPDPGGESRVSRNGSAPDRAPRKRRCGQLRCNPLGVCWNKPRRASSVSPPVVLPTQASRLLRSLWRPSEAPDTRRRRGRPLLAVCSRPRRSAAREVSRNTWQGPSNSFHEKEWLHFISRPRTAAPKEQTAHDWPACDPRGQHSHVLPRATRASGAHARRDATGRCHGCGNGARTAVWPVLAHDRPTTGPRRPAHQTTPANTTMWPAVVIRTLASCTCTAPQGHRCIGTSLSMFA